MSTAAKNFLVVKPVYQEQRRKLTKNVNLKRELLTVPPWQRRQNLIEVLPAHKNTEFQNIEYRMQVLNNTAIPSGYAGRDPQEETSDGSFFSKFSFMLQRMVKVLLLVLKKKREK